MNRAVEEMKGYLKHEGVSILDGAPGRGSGRYPLGSGNNPNQHDAVTFVSRIQDLKKSGFTFTDPKDGKTYKGESAIARTMGMTSTQLRAEYTLALLETKNDFRKKGQELLDKGYSQSAAARELGVGESTFRSRMKEESIRKQNQAIELAKEFKAQVDKHGMVDVGEGIEREMGGFSKERKGQALYLLELDGYHVWQGGVPTGPHQQTTLKVLAKPDVPHSEMYKYDKIYNMAADRVTHDGGDTFEPKFVYPASMDSKRIKINYAEDGGLQKDGLVELRRGVPDLSLGTSKYAQVRILVDGTHYVKGMAVYGDDDKFPAGVDLIFNTNKKRGTPKMDVLKTIDTKNPDNPFGSLIKEGIIDPNDPSKNKGGQSYYIDKDGNKKLSLINKRSEEGDWSEWADKLASQFLSKQPQKLIKNQLDLTYADKVKEFEEYSSLNNPTLKKAFLQSFADDCDASAVHLKAAALPRQKYQVIIPLTTTKDNEIFAPNYKNGETVALIRYPHGGTFEIPILKVNNRNKEGQKLLTLNAADAVGINAKVAERLSGADFDGDTVMVIPCNNPNSNIHIQSTPPLKGLIDFDPKLEYGPKDKNKINYRLMTDGQKGNEMGKITNLITDMTLLGAPPNEVERAVKHSMVVIDAVKHKLDYKRSEKENGIPELKKKWQLRINPETGRPTVSSATLISKAKSPVNVDKRASNPIVNPDGSLTWLPAKDLYYEERAKVRKKGENGRYLKDDKGGYVYETNPKTGKPLYEYTGKIKKHTIESTRMAETKDAYDLVSDRRHPTELKYADYANKMKALANEARKEILKTKDRAYDKDAAKLYKTEVDNLKAKVRIAEANAPRERAAMAIAASETKAMKAANPDVSKAEVKKFRAQANTRARIRTGAHREKFDITDKEWDAIQAGAVNVTTLRKVIKFTDQDKLKERSIPKYGKTGLSEVQLARIKSLAARGYTNQQIAAIVKVSASTVAKNL